MSTGHEWTDEQLQLLDAGGVPDNFRVSLLIFGSFPACVALAVQNDANLLGFWSELTVTPVTFEMKIWREPIVTTQVKGQRVRLHPSILPGCRERPEGPPAFEVVIDARENNEAMGVRLGVAYWQWLSIERAKRGAL